MSLQCPGGPKRGAASSGLQVLGQERLCSFFWFSNGLSHLRLAEGNRCVDGSILMSWKGQSEARRPFSAAGRIFSSRCSLLIFPGIV